MRSGEFDVRSDKLDMSSMRSGLVSFSLLDLADFPRLDVFQYFKTKFDGELELELELDEFTASCLD